MMKEPIIFSDLLLETKDGEWGEGQEAPGHVLCDVIRGTDFADLHSPSIELPQRWIPEHLVERKALKAGDILIETAGGTAKQSTGRTALITEEFLTSRGLRPVLCSSFARHLRVDRGKVHPAYLYYVLQPLYSSGYMGVFNLQHTGVSRFQFTAFRTKTRLRLHDDDAQPKIAAILAAYDDLIANNQRRIALMESMAEEIYREWFVRMRFPGANMVKFEKGVPTNWDIKTIGEIFNTASGGTPTREDVSNFTGNIPWVKTGELKNLFVTTTDEQISERAIETSAAKILPERTVVMAMYCAMPDVTILGMPAATNQACCALLPKNETIGYAWTYFFAKYALRELLNFTHGAAQQNLSQQIIQRFKVLAPHERIIKQFNEFSTPLLDQALLLQRENEQLIQIRSALLPRLISAKLRVDQLEIQYPPSMVAELEQPA